MKFVILHTENSMESAVETAVNRLNKQHNLNLELKFWTATTLSEFSPLWENFEQDFATSDFFMANMISFDNEQVSRLERMIKSEGDKKPDRAIVIINSMPSLMALTRMGDFKFENLLRFMKEGPIAKLSGFMKKKPKPGEEDEEYDPDEMRGKQSKMRTHKPARKGVIGGMIGVLRKLPVILKLIPGQAQDLRAYLLMMLYWLETSPENFEEFFKYTIDRYVPSYKGPKLKAKDPIHYPQLAIFHPEKPNQLWDKREDFEKWLAKHRPASTNRPRVGLITLQGSYLSGNRKHIEALVRQLQEIGIESVPCFVAGLDLRPGIETFFLQEDKHGKVQPTVDLAINLIGFSLVGGPAGSDVEAAVVELKRLNRPYWSILPLLYQSEEEWRNNRTGLSPLQVAFQVAVPELDGATEPRVYAGTATTGNDKSMYPFPEEMRRVATRIARLINLTKKANRDKKISIVLFSYPPNKGNIGTAAYLGVFESVFRLMQQLKAEGYNVELPASAEDLRLAVVEGNSAAYGTNGNLQAHLSVPDYQRLFPYWQELEPYWGTPPGALLSDAQGLQVLGRQFGNLLISIQPTFGYEDDPLRLLMADNVGTHHGFAAFYTYLDKVWKADAVLHFGTHGALEFMPGKQAGLTARCWPDRLIGDLPNYYLYCVNNPSEGTIARRRSYATLLSYLSPPMENAGLYRQLQQLKDTINRYRRALDEKREPEVSLLETIQELAAALDLDPKIDPIQNPTGYVLGIYTELLEIEERLIPTGLHILDDGYDTAMMTDVLNSIASFSRGKPGSSEEIQALTDLIAEGFGFDLEKIRELASRDSNYLAQWERINGLQREAVKILVSEYEKGNPEKGIKEAAYLLNHQARVDQQASRPMWEYLVEVAEALQQKTEISQIIRALKGEFIEPSPGSNIVQNPDVLPTGRNIHALDPVRIPTPLARRNAERSVSAMLERARQEAGLPEGQYPESIAMVLWGTDNIKTDGEGIAQFLYLVGARAITDGIGKVTAVKLLPLSELGRPRVDVIATVSGIFRDLMPNQMGLLDRAVRLAAKADEPPEMNFVRKHVQQEMANGKTFDEAVARIFSNAPGQYGANVNFMVDSSSWENDNELSETFLTRKSFVYGIQTNGQKARELMESALKNVELTFQNVDSAEIGITDVDHYYEYLGGVSKAVEKLSGGKRPPALVADCLSSTSGGLSQGKGIKTLQEAVKLESRTKLLNPKWYESMLQYGFEGVREIEVRVSNTYGFSATNDAVENWIYNDIDRTFVDDQHMRDRLTQLNPYSFKAIVGRLLEANSRNFWETDAATIERLKDIYAGLEDLIEGLGGEAPKPGDQKLATKK
jgi:magnesium chelatase subunit H